MTFRKTLPGLIGLSAMAWALIAPVSAQAAGEAAVAPADTDDGEQTILVTGQRERDALTKPNSTGSRLDLSLLETPATVTVIDGGTIRARGDLSIIDAQTRAPGITNAGNPGNGGTALAARGFAGQGSVLQLVDGVRLFPAAGTISFPTDPWMVERIDILNGPASVLYGQGALGAAVNVIMRKPSDIFVAEGEIGYGSQNSFHVSGGVGGPITEQLTARVDASYRRTDGYVDRGEAKNLSLSGTLRWTPTETLAFTLRHDYGDNNPMKYFGTPLIDGKLDTRIRERNFNVADAINWYEDNRITFQADWNVSESVTISNIVYRLTSKRMWQNLEEYYYDGGDILRTGNYGIVHDQTQWGNQGSITLRTPLSDGISNDLVVGFDVNSIKLKYSHDFNGDVQEIVSDPFNFTPGNYLVTVGITPQYRTKTNEFAFFAEDRLKLSEQFSIVGGIRYEEDKVKRWTIAGSGAETLAFEKKLNNTTWRVGGVYQPTKTVSLYAQYSTGVDPLGTLTTYSGGQVAFSNATGNQIEIGAKASFLDGRGTATIAGYRIVKNGLLSQRNVGDPIEQVGQRSSRGIEATVSLDLLAGFGIEANGTVLDAKFDDFISGSTNYNGKTPPGVAEEAANLWLRWDVLPQIQARGGLRYVGQTYADNFNRYRVPGYVTVDGSISYAVTPQLAVDFRVYNLFDKDYALNAYTDEQWVLGRPQSFDISLRARF